MRAFLVVLALEGVEVSLLRRAARALAALLTACSPGGRDAGQPSAAASDSAARAAVLAEATRFEAAIVAGDPRAIASFYVDDGTTYPGNAEPVKGRPAIEAMWKAALAAVKVTEARGTPESIDVLGDNAVVVGSYTMAARPVGKQEQLRDSGHYIFTFKKQADGTWKISRDISVSSLPAPKT